MVKDIAHKVVVLYKGCVVEKGLSEPLFKTPKAHYTKALLLSNPSNHLHLKRLPTIADFLNNSFKGDLLTYDFLSQKRKKIYDKPALLEVKNISKTFSSAKKWFSKPAIFQALNAISFSVFEGETLGIVGESGCGKTTLGRVLAGFYSVSSGDILYRGKSLFSDKKSFFSKGRELFSKETPNGKKYLKKVQLVFQDPYTALNPRIKVGDAIVEVLKVNSIFLTEAECKSQAIKLLTQVGLTESDFDKYPHAFSGGQRQRINIARAIALSPEILICDESVSALDVSLQAQVLNLLNDLKDQYGFTCIFISHDLSVIRYMSDRVIVMNKGAIEEVGFTETIFNFPQSSYMRNLLEDSFLGFY